MLRYLVLYVSAAIVFLPLDVLWRGVIVRDTYKTGLGDLLAPQLRWSAAVLFYLVYLVGVVAFAMAPAEQSIRTAFIAGAGFGFVAYAACNLPNLAALRGFPAPIAAMDLAWGTVLTGASAALGLMVASFVIDLGQEVSLLP